MKMKRTKVTLVLEIGENQDPSQWDWEEILDEAVVSVNSEDLDEPATQPTEE